MAKDSTIKKLLELLEEIENEEEEKEEEGVSIPTAPNPNGLYGISYPRSDVTEPIIQPKQPKVNPLQRVELMQRLEKANAARKKKRKK